MANSKGNTYPDNDRIRFKVLDALYSISSGYKHTFIPFDNLYKELQSKSNMDQELILESFEYLRKHRLVDSKALATASITHQGIKEVESVILGYGKHTLQLQPHIDKPLTNENEIKIVQNQRAAFLKKAYELSKGRISQPVSAFKIMDLLGLDQKTLERIYYYLEDEGLIKTYALGGDFTITQRV